jgi:hypothetical protein
MLHTNDIEYVKIPIGGSGSKFDSFPVKTTLLYILHGCSISAEVEAATDQ